MIETLSCCDLVMPDSFATLWTVAHKAPLSMGFPRQEYRNGLPFPSPGDLPYPGIKPMSPALAGAFFTTEPPGSPIVTLLVCKISQRTSWMCLRVTYHPKSDTG